MDDESSHRCQRMIASECSFFHGINNTCHSSGNWPAYRLTRNWQ
jgi:hypothetical protein